jgi:hypothetical protein
MGDRASDKVGEYLGAADFVPVSQAHIMADTGSLGSYGVMQSVLCWKMLCSEF